jgi:hypothetical protein
MLDTQMDRSPLVTGEIIGEQVFVHSPNSILQDDDQVELIIIRENVRRFYFRIGEIANKYIMGNARNNGSGVIAEHVYRDIGRLVGKKPRTIRYYADVQSFYADKDIHEFEVLPFSFFNYAKSFGDDICYQVLYTALLTPYMTLQELENVITAKNGVYDPYIESERSDAPRAYLGPVEPFWSGSRDDPKSAAIAPYKSDQDKPARVMSRHAITMLVTTIGDLIERLGRLSNRVAMPDEVIDRVDGCLSELRALLPLIARSAGGTIDRDTVDIA